MFSPHDSPAVNEWFRRLDAAWRRLPDEERANQREEVQQHLEGLVAASTALGQSPEVAWESALARFGDPTQIGRKICREWQQGRTGFRADMRAILFGVSLQVLGRFAEQLVFFFWIRRFYTHGQSIGGFPLTVNIILSYGGIVLTNAAIGRKYPFQALKGALYTSAVWFLWQCGFLFVALSFWPSNHLSQPLSAALVHSLLLRPLWMMAEVTISYLTSVTKRGWYKPSLTDFKLTLPQARRKPIR